MATIKEIEERLKKIEEPTAWLKELEKDTRAGVQKALARWQRQYDKREREAEAHRLKIAFDKSFAPFKGAHVAGVDEAGRGPLAGPVVTAAVILPEEAPALLGLDDSKSVSKEMRESLAGKIKDVAIAYAVHVQSAKNIDRFNIYTATKESMEKAVGQLSVRPDFAIVDAMVLRLDCPTEAVVKADAKSLAVAAASILAKTTRDAWMDSIHNDFPHYQFKKNAGYGTAEHIAALELHGPCEHHRKTFEPVKSILAGAKMEPEPVR